MVKKKKKKKSTSGIAGAMAAIKRFSLSLPEAFEDHPWGETVFKVNKKVFVFSHASAELLSLSTKLPASHELALTLPFASPTGYGLGKSGWVTARFNAKDKIPVELLKQWVEESYRAIAPKKLLKTLA